MIYLTFNEYIGFGGTAAEADFPLLEFKARKLVDYLTGNRVDAMAAVPNEVKMCLTALINLESKAGLDAQIDKPVVTSFTTDGYSESYGKALGVQEIQAEQYALIGRMLYGVKDDKGVPLLYRGVR